jgi:hypothetical protein
VARGLLDQGPVEGGAVLEGQPAARGKAALTRFGGGEVLPRFGMSAALRW